MPQVVTLHRCLVVISPEKEGLEPETVELGFATYKTSSREPFLLMRASEVNSSHPKAIWSLRNGQKLNCEWALLLDDLDSHLSPIPIFKGTNPMKISSGLCTESRTGHYTDAESYLQGQALGSAYRARSKEAKSNKH